MKKKKSLALTVAALLIAFCVAFTSGCGGLGLIGTIGCLGLVGSQILNNNDETETYTSETKKPEEETTGKQNGQISDGDALEIKYVEYDPASFNEKCEELTKLAASKDFDAISELYQELYDEITYVDENGSMLYILYSEDPTDEYYSEQYVSYDSLTTELSDTLLIALKAVCDGPCSSQFKELVGEDIFDAYADYEALTDEQLELKNRESELVDEYNTASADGEENGTDIAELNKILGNIYIELVQVRTKIAKTYGYDNYADYADENIYCRDFNGDDVAAFCNAVKKISAQAYNLTYYSTAGYAAYIVDNNQTSSQLLNELVTYAHDISGYSSTAADNLVNEHLYSIGNESRRMDGAYTMSLSKSEKAYIFAKLNESPTDFITLSHEFGHFVADYVNPNPNILVYGYGSLELAEIHSNGLQAIFTKYYDRIYGDDAGIMAAYNVLNLLGNVTDGCLMDEFQRVIYKNPNMTLDEINKLYRKLCGEYGMPTSDDDYWWMYVNHNFEAPMYYISYAASGIVALQIWTYTINDPDKAVDYWEKLIEAGCYTDSYLEVLDEIGLANFTNETSVIMTMNQAINFVENNSFMLN